MSELVEIKVGSVVERKNREGILVVKLIHGADAAVVDGCGKMEMCALEDLYLIPGQDYNYLRRRVIDTMDRLVQEMGRNNMHSDRFQLAVTRALYDSGVRCGDDLVAYAQDRIRTCVVDSISEGAVADMLRRDNERMSAVTGPVEIVQQEAQTLEQYTPEGAQTLAPLLSDDELANMCCDVADMLANGMGFTADKAHLESARYSGMTDLQRRVTYWSEPRGNVRKVQVWMMATKVVGHCRMAEIADAIENVLESIRQQEDPDD